MANRNRTAVRTDSVPLVSALADSVSLLPIYAATRSLERQRARYLFFASWLGCNCR